MHPTAEVLQNARNVLTNESNWTQGTYARDAKGGFSEIHSESATCFCSLGAIRKVMTVDEFQKGDRYTSAHNALRKTLMLRNPGAAPVTYNIPSFNDCIRTTHADVLSLFDETIERLNQ